MSLINWLLNSGIQNNRSKGGFNSWYEIKNKSYPFIYPEITGYAITFLLYLIKTKRVNGIEVQKRAEIAAKWLLSHAVHKNGGIRVRFSNNHKTHQSKYLSSNLLYSFDSGIVLYGLISLYKQIKKHIYLDIAKKIAKFLISLQKKDGSFFPIYDAKNKKVIDSQDKWSTQSGSYHAKLALGLIDLFDITNDCTYRESAIKICEYAIKLQQKNGRFITFKDNMSTHFHPHCYSAEGILYTGTYLKRNDFINSAALATRWLLNNQLKNGGVPSLFIQNKFITHERSDVLSQTLRLGALLIHFGFLDKSYKSNLSKLFYRLCGFQSKSPDLSQNGGIIYGFETNGKAINDINSWCSMFALQAIIMYQQLQEKRPISLVYFV